MKTATKEVETTNEESGGHVLYREAKAKVQTKAQAKSVDITITPPKMEVARITIVGTSPLLMHKFSDKARKQMDDKRAGKAQPKQPAATKAEEMEAALYRLDKGYGFPVGAFKKCAVKAAQSMGLRMGQVNAAFHVTGDTEGLIPLKCSPPVMDERIVRQKGAMGAVVSVNRVRPRFDKWEATFNIAFMSGLVSGEQLVNLYEFAGFSVGLGDYRPERGGSCGMFQVARR